MSSAKVGVWELDSTAFPTFVAGFSLAPSRDDTRGVVGERRWSRDVVQIVVRLPHDNLELMVRGGGRLAAYSWESVGSI